MANRQKRDCFAGHSVIARNEAISVFYRWRTDKREIASQARLYLSSRGTKRSRLNLVIARDVAISPFQGWLTDKREIATLRSPLCHREGRGDLGLLSCRREERSDLGCPGLADREKRDCRATLASLSSRGTWRSRLSNSGKQTKERLLRRLAMTVGVARNEAISPFQSWRTVKREIAALRSQPPQGALTRQRHEAISPFQSWRTEKREIAALRSQ